MMQYLLLKNEVEKYSDLNQYEFGEKILELMYENVLTKYDLLSTEIQVMLTAGKYNCVSASLLYLALATDCGLDARVQETEKHAFITLYLDDGQKIDVETTNPYGFNPGKKKELPQGNNSVSKKYVTVPKNYYSNRKEASKLKAISIIAKNRCKLMGDKRDYKNAIPLGASAYLFVQNEKEMKSIVDKRKEKERNKRLDAMLPAHMRRESGAVEDDVPHLNLIIKANTHGSAEAVSQAIAQLESDEIVTKIENETLPLEESLKLYEEGKKLISVLEKTLKEAESKVEELQK